jgi:hypothetical protein
MVVCVLFFNSNRAMTELAVLTWLPFNAVHNTQITYKNWDTSDEIMRKSHRIFQCGTGTGNFVYVI